MQNDGRYLLGIDESGTGAWAGSFYVAGVVLPYHGSIEGAGDSKKLTDKRRRALLDAIDEGSVYWLVQDVSVEDIEGYGQAEAWRRGIVLIVRDVLKEMRKIGVAYGYLDVLVDGKVNHKLREALQGVRPGLRVLFEPKADERYPGVGAASILAKTARNDTMNDLHEVYPEYGWNRNAGYGTEEHAHALVEYGRTVHHRPLTKKWDLFLRT
jgi:ribonuclease HII